MATPETYVDWARSAGYKVTPTGKGGMYTITNPATGKSMQAWEGTQYTPGGAIGTVSAIGGLKTPEQVRQEVMAGRVSGSSSDGGSS